jgi:hypothetical protein
LWCASMVDASLAREFAWSLKPAWRRDGKMLLEVKIAALLFIKSLIKSLVPHPPHP